MKCQSPTERFNNDHMKRVIEARRAREERLTAEAIRDGRSSTLVEPRKHKILNP